MAIFKNTFKIFVKKPITYFYWLVSVLGFGIVTYIFNLKGNDGNLLYTSVYFMMVMTISTPFLSFLLRSVFYEKKAIAYLRTYGISPKKIIVEKYLSLLCVCLPLYVFYVLCVLFLNGLGTFALTSAMNSILGLLLLNAIQISILVLISSFEKNKWLDFTISEVSCIVLFGVYLLIGAVNKANIVALIFAILLSVVIGWLVYAIFKKKIIALIALLVFVSISIVLYFVIRDEFIVFVENFIRCATPVYHITETLSGYFSFVSIIICLLTIVVILVATIRMFDKSKHSVKGKSITALLFVILLIVNGLCLLLPNNVMYKNIITQDNYEISDEAKAQLKEVTEDVTFYYLGEGNKQFANIDVTSYLEKVTSYSSHLKWKYIDILEDVSFVNEHNLNDVTQGSILVYSEKRERLLSTYEFYYFVNTQMGKKFTYLNYYLDLLTFMSGEDTSSEEYYYGQYLYSYADYTYEVLQLEQLISNAIEYVTKDHVANICSYMNGDDYNLDIDLQQEIIQEGYDYHIINSLDSISNNYDCIIISSLSKDLTESEAKGLKDYLNNGGSIYVLTNYTNTEFINLYSVLNEYGFGNSTNYSIICEAQSSYCYTASSYDSSGNSTSTTYPYIFIPHMETNIFPNIQKLSAYIYYAHPIEITPVEGVEQYAWLHASSNSYIYNLKDGTNGTEKSAYMCGAVAKKGNSTCVWISSGSSLFLDNGNADFFMQSLKAITNSTIENRSMQDKVITSYSIAPSKAQIVCWFVFIIILLPLAIAGAGCLVDYLRKKS